MGTKITWVSGADGLLSFSVWGCEAFVEERRGGSSTRV